MKKTTVKINFLEKKKTTNDKIFDLLETHTKKVFGVHKKGKKKGEDYYKGRSGKKALAKKLGTNTRTLTKWEKFGVEKLTKGQKKKIRKLWNEKKEVVTAYFEKDKKTKTTKEKAVYYEYEVQRIHNKTKQETKQFTKHTFTRENFFHKKKLPKRKKRQQFYFRVGLFLKFINGYTIQNLPLSHYDFKGYPEGYNAMWNLIRLTISKYDSLLFFRINYFDVLLLDL